MNTYFQRWQGHPAHMVRDCILFACAFAVLYSVALSFIHYHWRGRVVRKKRSAVDTLTMLLFFAGYAKLLALNIGAIQPGILEMPALVLGTVLTAVGAVVNVLGRKQLGTNWANQIHIYENHRLQTAGYYRWVRHPLYASTIWMFLGAALAAFNLAAFAATCMLFIPAMHYRARQEERLLAERFPEYEMYRRRTGMFFPRLKINKELP